MALGRRPELRWMIPGPPARSPQRVDRALDAELRRAIYSQRTVDLLIIPGRSRVYFGRDLPVRAPRVAPPQPDYGNLRDTLVARSRFFAAAAQKKGQA